MTGFRFITAADIALWAERRVNAPSQLPLLLHKLVVAISPPIVQSDFPGDKGVGSPGWDGWVKNGPAQNRYIPDGESVWELSTDKQVFGKANRDFTKRSKYPGTIKPAKTTFVAVSAREWRVTKSGDKRTWAAAKKKTKVWAKVIAYDAHDLAAWLELAPQVALWACQEMNLPYPRGLRDLRKLADRFLHQGPPPPLDAADLLVKRDTERDKIHAWLRQPKPAGPLIIDAGSEDEAATFFAAAVFALPASERESVECRSIAVMKEDDFLELTESIGTGLIVLAHFANSLKSARYAMNKLGHRVVLTTAQGGNQAGCTVIKLGPLPVETFEKTLKSHGMDDETIHNLEIETQRDLTVITRKLEGTPAPWLEQMEPRILLTLMLTRTWRDTEEGDQAFLAKLSGRTYAEFVALLAAWHGRPDSPVRKLGNVWRVTGADEIALGLAGRMTQPLLTLWSKLTTEVFCTLNPKFELQPDERFAAGLHGKHPAHSGELRAGLANALAALASHPPKKWLAQVRPADAVDHIGHKIFTWAKDWQKWASLGDQLPLLAEAAPGVFLATLQDTLERNAQAVTGLFGQESDFGGSPHVGLVWALEQFAWNPTYFSRAMQLLAQLAELDTGGRWSPRPQDALQRILCFWRPQSNATREVQQAFITLLRKRYPKVAWEILRNLMPSGGGVTSDITKPQWRKWHEGAKDSTTEGEYWTMVLFAAGELLALAGNDPAQLADLLREMLAMPNDTLNAFFDALAQRAREPLTSAQRLAIWSKLRQILHDHRKFPNADWAVGPEVIKRLDELYAAFTPTGAVEKYSWLFDQHPSLPSGGDENWSAEEKQVASARHDALDQLWAAGGMPAILAATDAATSPWSLGYSFALHPLAEEHEDEFLQKTLTGAKPGRLVAAHGFISVRFRNKDGWTWATAKLPAKRAAMVNFLTGLPFTPATWNVAREKGPAVESAYWVKISPGIPPEDLAEAERAVRSLLAHGRPMAALALCGTALRAPGKPRVGAPLLLEVMEAAAHADPKNPADPVNATMLTHYLQEILDILGDAKDVDEKRVASLEFNLIELFSYDRGRKPKVLHRQLAADPGFFVELVSYAFRAKGEEAKQPVPADKLRLAGKAYRVLKSWRTVPGLQADDSVDAAQLKQWIMAVRKLCAAQKRGEVADSLIGELLAHAPGGKDGHWPAENVRPVIEEVSTEKMRNGIRIGLFNKRSGGFRHRGVNGNEERTLAAASRASAEDLRDRWPHLAAIHEGMAVGYDHDAERVERERE